MARSHPHPDHERERFPLAWEDDDTPGLSVHALTRADAEAILASMPDEPDDTPPLRLPSQRTAAAAPPRASTSAAARPSMSLGRAPGPCASPPPCWPGLTACWWRSWRAYPG